MDIKCIRHHWKNIYRESKQLNNFSTPPTPPPTPPCGQIGVINPKMQCFSSLLKLGEIGVISPKIENFSLWLIFMASTYVIAVFKIYGKIYLA